MSVSVIASASVSSSRQPRPRAGRCTEKQSSRPHCGGQGQRKPHTSQAAQHGWLAGSGAVVIHCVTARLRATELLLHAETYTSTAEGAKLSPDGPLD